MLGTHVETQTGVSQGCSNRGILGPELRRDPGMGNQHGIENQKRKTLSKIEKAKATD